MEGMKIPTRPAPKPPDTGQRQNKPFRSVSDTKTPFLGGFKLTRSQSTGKLSGNKKPPPRPPPPSATKLLRSTVEKSSVPSHYSSFKQNLGSQMVMSGGFPNKSGVNFPRSLSSHTSIAAKQQAIQCAELIDFNSPHTSPTHTSRSNSDNLSLNSFSSEGTYMGFNCASRVESGFEDDFDSLTISSSTTMNSVDPWGDDPFSPARPAPQTLSPYQLSNEDPKWKRKDSSNNTSVPLMSMKPTIIRSKNTKPARPPPPRLRPASTPPKFISAAVDVPDDWSPPMPSCPPPPPPPEALTILQNGPAVPQRPLGLVQETVNKKKPYCIALYDYDSGHIDDLSFKMNDVIFLTEKVNEDWMRGSLDGKEGMFPVSYTKVVVPMDDCGTENSNDCKYAIALYTFRAETWDDLPFEEGETVKVIRRINNEWLYGECNGKQGQFPENYITDVSSLFPQGSTFS